MKPKYTNGEPGSDAGWMRQVDWFRGNSLAHSDQLAGTADNVFGVAPPACRTVESSGFIGDTRRGGSCNVQQIDWIPHCHGTHTESISHIIDELIPVIGLVPPRPVRAILLSVTPVALGGGSENYGSRCDPQDSVITVAALQAAMSSVMAVAGQGNQGLLESGDSESISSSICEALIVRTGWRYRSDSNEPPSPYFTDEAMRWVVGMGVQHLLVESASVDRLQDDGRLTNHRIYWQVETGSRELNANSRRWATITELIQVPVELVDGPYALMLSVFPWRIDAAPAVPWIFPCRR